MNFFYSLGAWYHNGDIKWCASPIIRITETGQAVCTMNNQNDSGIFNCDLDDLQNWNEPGMWTTIKASAMFCT